MFLIYATDVNEVAVVLRRQVEHACGMQSGFADDAPLLVDVVIAVDGVIDQGDAFDDEFAVVGDAAADVPAMLVKGGVVRKQVAFDLKHYVHRFEDDAFSPVEPQGNLGDVAVAETQLEVPVEVAVAQGEHGIELLEAVACEATVEIAVFDEDIVPSGKTVGANLVGQIETMPIGARLIAQVKAVSVVESGVESQNGVRSEFLGPGVIAFHVEPVSCEALGVGTECYGT